MTGPACLVYDDLLTAYDFGSRHPLNPVRVKLTIALAAELGILRTESSPNGLPVVEASTAPDELLATVHDPEYIKAVRAASENPRLGNLDAGLGTTDNPTFSGMHEASAHIAGASVEAARMVWEGETLHAANVAGGLHHAMPDQASGFCVYNDPALAIQWLLDAGCPKVAYLDLDVHHGDGVQEIFYDDPRVLTISLHETPHTLFPYVSGFPTETGGDDAEGSAVNVALPGGTRDPEWLRAFHAVVPPLLNAFVPDVIVSQHGCDSHRLDPLAHLALSVDGQRAAALAVHELAHEVCDGRWIATGGGGYALIDVVPRTWSHLLAIVGGSPADPETPVPHTWLDTARSLAGREVPETMTDGADTAFRDWSEGFDPADDVDRTILATMRAVFPSHGLDLDY
ncbi:acetoin utilization protein AcuC [Flindersiella endophytica]